MATSPKSRGLGNISPIVNRSKITSPVKPVAKMPVPKPVTTTFAQRQAAPSPFRNNTKQPMAKVNPLQQAMQPKPRTDIPRGAQMRTPVERPKLITDPMQPAPQPFNPQPTPQPQPIQDFDFEAFRRNFQNPQYNPSMGGTEDLYNQYNNIRNRMTADIQPEDRMNFQQFVDYRNGKYTPPTDEEFFGSPTPMPNPNPNPGQQPGGQQGPNNNDLNQFGTGGPTDTYRYMLGFNPSNGSKDYSMKNQLMSELQGQGYDISNPLTSMNGMFQGKLTPAQYNKLSQDSRFSFIERPLEDLGIYPAPHDGGVGMFNGMNTGGMFSGLGGNNINYNDPPPMDPGFNPNPNPGQDLGMLMPIGHGGGNPFDNPNPMNPGMGGSLFGGGGFAGK